MAKFKKTVSNNNLGSRRRSISRTNRNRSAPKRPIRYMVNAIKSGQYHAEISLSPPTALGIGSGGEVMGSSSSGPHAD